MEFNKLLTAPGTFEDMCTIIAEAQILEKDGRFATAEEIYNYSPTGEVHTIRSWYFAALEILGKVSADEIDKFIAVSMFPDLSSNEDSSERAE